MGGYIAEGKRGKDSNGGREGMSGKLKGMRKMGYISIAIIAALLLAMAVLPVVTATTTTLQPLSADSYLDAGNPSSNFGKEEIIAVYSCQGAVSPVKKDRPVKRKETRGIIRFDLSKIPPGAHIQQATLKLYCVEGEEETRIIGVHRVQQDPQRDWGEKEVTWNIYKKEDKWTTPGGDFNKKATDNIEVGAPEQWYSWDVIRDVQDFVAKPKANFGWIIKEVEEKEKGKIRDEEEEGDPKFFASKEWDNEILRPTLEVTYISKTIISCDREGNEVDQFVPGEEVYVRAEGLEAKTRYGIWIQDDPVIEGDKLIKSENPESAKTPMKVKTDKRGNLKPTLIWSIPEDAPPSHHLYDIVFDKQEDPNEGKYNAASDGLDSSSVAGIVAPVPDVSSLVLFASGMVLMCIFRRWKEEKRETELKGVPYKKTEKLFI
ncbi:MAG: DNRLRE domain-containing protein, partial [Methanophagales archaeon]|nr:DNRLRE domain-containing protein [Methanophagales archaeon]